MGARVGSRLRPGAILLLDGPLGAGKTTLAKGIASGIGVGETVTSPTYTIVSEYRGTVPLYHVDLYRISGEDEYVQLGLDDLLFGEGVSLIEWPDRAGSELPRDAVRLTLRVLGGTTREIDGPAELLAPEER